MTKLSIIIPCYNEGLTISQLIQKVQRVNLPADWTKEILIIDDASTDKTNNILTTFSQTAKIVIKEKNEGKGSALKEGFRLISGDYILIQDADLEYDPEDYPALLDPIIRGETEIVFGSRNLRNDNKPTNQIFKYGGLALTKLFNLLFQTSFTDITSCYKIFPKKYIPHLLALPSNDFVYDGVELTHALSKLGVIKEVPIHYQGRSKKEGKKISGKDAIKFAWAMFKIKTDPDDRIRRWRERKVLKYIKPEAVVLDLGCGQNFHFLKMIKNRIRFGYGLDKKVLPNEDDKLKILNYDFDTGETWPLPTPSLDQVFLLAVLEHLNHPERALEKIYCSLKDGGELFLTTPTPTAKPLLEFLAFKVGAIDALEIKDHKHYFSKKELQESLKEIGFREIRHHYFELGLNQLVTAKK